MLRGPTVRFKEGKDCWEGSREVTNGVGCAVVRQRSEEVEIRLSEEREDPSS